jgi:hypothetical protein
MVGVDAGEGSSYASDNVPARAYVPPARDPPSQLQPLGLPGRGGGHGGRGVVRHPGCCPLVFLAAGIGKLLNRERSRNAVIDFGVGARRAGGVALAVPILELTTASLLLVHGLAPLGDLLAIALLALYPSTIRRPRPNASGSDR